MAELIWLIIVLLLGFALGWAARSHIFAASQSCRTKATTTASKERFSNVEKPLMMIN